MPTNDAFAEDFAKILQDENGDWRGFVFPRGFTLPERIDFAIDARQCQCDSLHLDKTVFSRQVDLSDSTFRRTTALRGVIFEGSATFDRCRFSGPVDMLNVQFKQAASFHRAEFFERTILRINVEGLANFNEVVFREAVQFVGWTNTTIVAGAGTKSIGGSASGMLLGDSKPTVRQRLLSLINQATDRFSVIWQRVRQRAEAIRERARQTARQLRRRYAKTSPNTRHYRVFEGDGQLQGVIFMKPEQTSFTQLDMWNVYLSGTNLRGVRFLGVTWVQKALCRNGLRDELFIRYSKDGPFRHQQLPALEETCRNARVAFEEARSFRIASDFYIAEMQAVRQQMGLLRRSFFSIVALYWICSKYGTSVTRALVILALIFVSYITATMYMGGNLQKLITIQNISDTALRSLQLLVFHATDLTGAKTPPAQPWADTPVLPHVILLPDASRSLLPKPLRGPRSRMLIEATCKVFLAKPWPGSLTSVGNIPAEATGSSG